MPATASTLSPAPGTAGAAPTRSRTARTLAAVRLTAFAALVSILAAAVLALVVVPRATGSTTYTVLTGSMQPTYAQGTVIVSQPRAIQDIRIGDAVTYQLHSGRPEVVTHRVVGKGQDAHGEITLTLRGDANSLDDPKPVIAAQVKGVVIYAIPFAGLLLHDAAANAPLWLTLVGAAFILWGAGYVVAHLLGRRSGRRGSRGRRRADQRAAA